MLKKEGSLNMFFNLFRRKNKEEDTVNTQEDVKQNHENTKTKVISEIPFEEKIIYLLEGKEAAFPRGFEKEKYFTLAKEVYESSNAKDVIEKIKITRLTENVAGYCIPKVCNNKLLITIVIEEFKLGINSPSKVVLKDDKCIEFRNILAHEIIHAEDEKRIIDEYGEKEYQAIIDNEIAKLGKTILTEYTACRKAAENYAYFDSTEDIKKKVNGIDAYLGYKEINAIQFENPGEKELEYARDLNYAIATWCAFADVSNEYEKKLHVPTYIKKHKEYTKYILSVRSLLRANYEKQPLNEEKYQKLGQQIMSELATIYSMNN